MMETIDIIVTTNGSELRLVELKSADSKLLPEVLNI